MTGNQRTIPALVLLLAALFLWPAGACAEEMLQNTGFETYDAGTLVPDNWSVLEGSVESYTDKVYEDSASVYSLGGTAAEDEDGKWVVTPNSSQGGSIAQVVDLSAMSGYADANWLSLSVSSYVFVWGGTSAYVYVEYLPPAYDSQTITVDDAAWSSTDTVTATYARRTGSYTSWRKISSSKTIPKVRWARVRIVLDTTWKEYSRFSDGNYYITVDTVSLDAEAVVPEEPCTGNLLSNPGFESFTDGQPDDWQVLSGSMAAIRDLPLVPAYNGAAYAGNVGGTAVDGEDTPNETQAGSLVQLLDISGLSNWDDATYVTFNFSLYYLLNYTTGSTFTVEYLPEAYNNTSVTFDDAAWDADAVTAVTDDLGSTSGLWKTASVGPGSMPKVRWVRVRLNVDTTLNSSSFTGTYVAGFDQVCLTADVVMAGDLIENADFEAVEEDGTPTAWNVGTGSGPVTLQTGDDGNWLAKEAGEDDVTATVYQVIDLADSIVGWLAIEADGGSATELQFIKYALSAMVANFGGTSVKIGLEYLPYSYNEVNDIAWDNEAWAARDWTPVYSEDDGAYTTFTNNGGDAINAGCVIEDTTADSQWREVNYDGWLPRVRWIRLRIEFDAALTGETALVGIDDIEFSAHCSQWGPYSGFGDLPEATFYEDPDAPDKAIPAWVGPEGDGISGGYTGQTEQNYVNPIFAGFADSVADYTPSGQYIYNVAFEEPLAITGPPWNDSGWSYVIVTLGDMSVDMLADYFGPAPSGTYQPGSVTAKFDETPIVNGDGPDFATFENGFSSGWTSPWIFAELAYVEVSSNGTDFIRFPTHSLTPEWPGAYGCILASGVFGMTGKHINAYGDAWGTPFDLDWIADHPLVLNGTVDLNNIRYVRQVDIPGGGPADAQGSYTGFFYDDYGNVIFDSWLTWGSGGVDLDAVAVIHTSATDSDGDNISDYWDNCPSVANEKQYDTDEDGYGNMCDCDINGDEGGDGRVNYADYLIFRAAYGSNGPIMIAGDPGEDNEYADASENWNADADFNGDLKVNYGDYLIFRSRYGSSSPFE